MSLFIIGARSSTFLILVIIIVLLGKVTKDECDASKVPQSLSNWKAVSSYHFCQAFIISLNGMCHEDQFYSLVFEGFDHDDPLSVNNAKNVFNRAFETIWRTAHWSFCYTFSGNKPKSFWGPPIEKSQHTPESTEDHKQIF